MSLRRNLVAHWSLDETGGYRADDHGAGQLSDVNTVGYATGVLGNAADFELSNSERLPATLADIGASPGDADLTICTWVKLESKATDQGIVTCDNGTVSGRAWRLEYDVDTDRFRFLIFAAASAYGVVGTASATTFGSPSTGAWYFIAAWHNVADNQVGIQVNNGTADTASTTAAMGGAVTGVWFGAFGSNGTPINFFDGLIDETAIWRRLLTSDEKAQIYNSGAGYAWSSWYTNDALDPLHTAHAADVLAYDATGFSYEVTLTVNQTGRHAIGVMLLQSDDGDQLALKIGGSTVETLTTDDDFLAVPFGSYFETGFIYDFTSTGSKTIKVESVSNASVIKGVIVREPDAVSGIVEDQGAATHCSPLRCEYGGSVYRVHVEMYTGNIYLAVDEAMEGLLFAGDKYNEKYHNSTFCVALSGGVAVGQVGHNVNGIRVRYLPSGAYANITSEYDALSTTSFTYCQVQVLLDDRIAILTRATANQWPAFVLIADADQIDGTGASATIDYIYDPDGLWVYPKGFEYYVNGSTEVLGCLFNDRDGDTNWHSFNAALFCPQEGAYGEWYTLAGDNATVQNALGTTDTPRFNATMRDALTSAGGIAIVNSAANTQRYALAALFKVTQWPSGATTAKGAMLLVWADAAGTALTEYNAASSVRFAIQNEATRTLDSSFNELPSSAELDLSPNNYRLDAAIIWEDDDDTGDALLAITDRGFGYSGSGKGATFELPNNYYDWGGNEIVVLRIANPMTPASITFAEEMRIEAGQPYRAGWLISGGTNRFVYQTGENQLHATHRQSVRKEIYLGAVTEFTGYWGINASIQ